MIQGGSTRLSNVSRGTSPEARSVGLFIAFNFGLAAFCLSERRSEGIQAGVRRGGLGIAERIPKGLIDGISGWRATFDGGSNL